MTTANEVAITTSGVTSIIQVTDQLFRATNPVVASGTPYVTGVIANTGMTSISGRCYCDVAGTVTFQCSDDGVTWDTLGTHAIAATTVVPFTDTPNGAVMRYQFNPTSGSSSVLRFSAYAIGARSV